MNNALISFQPPPPVFQWPPQVQMNWNVPAAPPQQQEQKVNVPAFVTIGSALLYLFCDNEAVKALALQGFSIGGAAWMAQSMN
jgi:hypothetical protein